MTDEQKAPAPKKKAAPKKPASPSMYVNKSSRNIFTEAGRVAPEGNCFLTDEQAKQYKGLEPCQENSEQSEDS